MRSDSLLNQFPPSAGGIDNHDHVTSGSISSNPQFAILVSSALRVVDRYLSSGSNSHPPDVSSCQPDPEKQ
jgi:hypothetical protein